MEAEKEAWGGLFEDVLETVKMRLLCTQISLAQTLGRGLCAGKTETVSPKLAIHNNKSIFTNMCLQ